MLVLGNIIRPRQLRYNNMVSKIIPAFDLKGFMLVLGNIIDYSTDAKQGATICRSVIME